MAEAENTAGSQNTAGSPRSAGAGAALRMALAGLVLSVVGAALCAWAAGPTLGAFLGGVAVAAILAAPLTLSQSARWGRVLTAAAIVDGIALVWLVVVLNSPYTFVQWLLCYALLAAFVAAFTGLAAAMARLGLTAVLASAVAVLIAVAWVSWPAWSASLARSDRGLRVAEAIAPAQPLLAMNRALISPRQERPVIWGEQTLAYRHLADRVRYMLPATIWPALAGHGLLGAALWMAAERKRRAT